MKQVLAWWRRSFREGSVQVWRNKFLSLTTIGLGVLILVLLNFVFGVRYFATYSLEQLEQRADFSVPLREVYDEFEFSAMQNQLVAYDVELTVLPAQEFDDFSLPARYHVKFHDISQVGEVLDVFKSPRYVEVVGNWDGVSEREFVTVVGNLLQLRKNIEKAAQVLVMLFLAGGVLVVLNTFRIVIFSRRDEVFVARLVGATPGFIAGPFIVEGILLGLMAAVLSIFIFVLLLRQVAVLPGGVIFLHLWNHVFALELLAAAAVGGGGAWLSVRRYLLSRLR